MLTPWLEESIAANGHRVKDNFLQWFGASRVVDGNGAPRVMFHGTAEDFSQFDPGRAGQEKRSDWGRGVYFTPNASTADFYRGEAAKKRDQESNRLFDLMQEEEKRTVWVDGSPQYTAEHTRLLTEFRRARAAAEYLSGSVMPVYLRIENPFIQKYSSMPDPFLAQHAKEHGHDGIFVLTGGGEIDEVVVFDPHQIKSALGSSGLYLKNSASLTDTQEAKEAKEAKEALKLIRSLKARQAIPKQARKEYHHAYSHAHAHFHG